MPTFSLSGRAILSQDTDILWALKARFPVRVVVVKAIIHCLMFIKLYFMYGLTACHMRLFILCHILELLFGIKLVSSEFRNY